MDRRLELGLAKEYVDQCREMKVLVGHRLAHLTVPAIEGLARPAQAAQLWLALLGCVRVSEREHIICSDSPSRGSLLCE